MRERNREIVSERKMYVKIQTSNTYFTGANAANKKILLGRVTEFHYRSSCWWTKFTSTRNYS